MDQRIPATIAAVCLSVYWFWVLVKLVRLGLTLGKDPNALPRETVGKLMRIVWYPCVLALLAGLWTVSLVTPRGQEHWPVWARGLLAPLRDGQITGWGWWVALAVAAIVCVAFTAMTFVCWRKMGRSWRIGIDPGEKLELVSTGPYRYVRHPIYALRMVINICAMILAPSPLVIGAAAVDFLLLQIEARREERYMERTHGAEYVRYKKAVGRFVPRITSQ